MYVLMTRSEISVWMADCVVLSSRSRDCGSPQAGRCSQEVDVCTMLLVACRQIVDGRVWTAVVENKRLEGVFRRLR
jgi:hypothetical protein